MLEAPVRTAKLPSHELYEMGMRHILHMANSVDPIRFHDDLNCIIEAGASLRLIARTMSLDLSTVQHWRHGGMPTNEFSIVVVNKWAEDVRRQLG